MDEKAPSVPTLTAESCPLAATAARPGPCMAGFEGCVEGGALSLKAAFLVRMPVSACRVLCLAALAVGALLLQGCSAVKLAYNQVPHLAYWQLHHFLDLSENQSDRVRSDLGLLHQWHRGTMLPRHAELLQQVQQQLPAPVTPDQVCRIYDDARVQLDAVWAQTELQLVWLASQLSPAQIRHLEKKAGR